MENKDKSKVTFREDYISGSFGNLSKDLIQTGKMDETSGDTKNEHGSHTTTLPRN